MINWLIVLLTVDQWSVLTDADFTLVTGNDVMLRNESLPVIPTVVESERMSEEDDEWTLTATSSASSVYHQYSNVPCHRCSCDDTRCHCHTPVTVLQQGTLTVHHDGHYVTTHLSVACTLVVTNILNVCCFLKHFVDSHSTMNLYGDS